MRMTSSRQPSGTPEKNKLIAITSPPLFFLFHSHNCLSQSRTHPRRAKARAPFALPTSYRVRHTPKKPSLSVARAVFPQTTLGTHSQVNLFLFFFPFPRYLLTQRTSIYTKGRTFLTHLTRLRLLFLSPGKEINRATPSSTVRSCCVSKHASRGGRACMPRPPKHPKLAIIPPVPEMEGRH